MRLTGPEIKRHIQIGDIQVTPFELASVGPCSLDLRLGRELCRPRVHYPNQVLNTHHPGTWFTEHIPDGGYLMMPGQLYLASTVERISLQGLSGTVFGRSSAARYGITVESAGFVDDGFDGTITLEIVVVHPILVHAGDRICQIAFDELVGEREPYVGSYSGSHSPVPPKPLNKRKL